jgi:hypothetical protein
MNGGEDTLLAESLNADVAQELSERSEPTGHRQRWEEIAEIVEVLFLAVVAMATAWSGFQAAKWDGREAALYQDATRDRFEAEAASTLGGLELVSDSALFTAWLQAQDAGDVELAKELTLRFTPDFREDFDAWRASGAAGSNVEPDVGFMPGLDRNPNVQDAARLNTRSASAFIRGRQADAVADKYVRNSVLLAMVLFLVAIAQRFSKRGVRIGMNAVALLMLVYVVGSTATLPRLV